MVPVIPAQAGTQSAEKMPLCDFTCLVWVPACAGMT